MGKYQGYPEYRESGVEWLGEVPSHWVISRVKYTSPFHVGWTPPTSNDSNFIGDNLWVNISDLKQKLVLDTAKRISDKAVLDSSISPTKRGSLMYSFKLSVGAVAFAGVDLYTNEAIASFTPNKELPLSFLYYALPIFVIQNKSTNIYGASILNQELIKNAILPNIDFDEAKNIAKFLDHETAKIDTLIEKQRMLIGLLQEKRQAVISHAVTKGLDSSVPMKDSGVGWLGEVPEHWIVGRLKNALRIRNGRDYKHIEVDVGGYPIYGSGGIFKRGSDYLYDGKSVLYGRKGTVDKPLLVEGRFWTVDTMFYSEVFENVLPEYAYYQSTLFPFGLLSTNTALPSMTQEDLLELGFVLPDKEEQKSICKEISRRLHAIDDLVEACNKQLALLEERRTALISAAVTGKIDVRDVELS